jgi:hypothetical protein
MQVTGAVHKIEVRPARDKYPERTVLVLTDRNGPALTDLAEETYFEVDLQGDGKSLKAGDMVSFWGRFSWARGNTIAVQCRGQYKVNGK